MHPSVHYIIYSSKDMETTYVFIDGRMDKENVVYVFRETLSSLKKNEILPFVKTWMDLEGIMLNEMSEKDKEHMILLTCRTKNNTIKINK